MADVTLSTSAVSFDDLLKKYDGFMAPTAKLKLNGEDAVNAGMAITSVRVSTSTSVDTDTAVVTIGNAYDEIDRKLEWYGKFKLGNTMEVELGYKDKLKTVFSGYVTAVHFQYPKEGTPTVALTGMDMSFKLMRGQKIRTWKEKKVSDVAKEIASEYGLTAEVDDTGTKLPYLAKGYRSDFQFLQDLALTHNYEFFIVGKKLYFRKRFKTKTPIITLKYMYNLHEFTLEHNLSEQVSGVEVHGWDVKEQKRIVGTSNSVDKINKLPKTGPNILTSMGSGDFVEHVYANPETQSDANNLAKAILNARALKLVSGEGETVGLPELRAGVFIKVEGLSSELDESYYVSRATHLLDQSGYITQFQVQGNAVT